MNRQGRKKSPSMWKDWKTELVLVAIAVWSLGHWEGGDGAGHVLELSTLPVAFLEHLLPSTRPRILLRKPNLKMCFRMFG